MNQYVTGQMIKKLRTRQHMTQAQLAEKLGLSDKTISKWETGNGFPDVSILEELSDVLKTSIAELLSGNEVINSNKSFNMLKTKLYVCPICGNVIQSTGDAVVSCCGVTLPLSEAEEPDVQHMLTVEKIDDEYYVTSDHEMSKKHFISFIAAVKDNGIDFVKLYPESVVECRFKIGRIHKFVYYCNRHGLYSIKV